MCALNETRRRFSVRHHHDLFHVFALRLQDAAREPQTFRGVRVVRTNLRRRQFRQRKFLGRIVKQHNLQRIARILRANQMTERQRDFLGRREAVFAVENHRVRTVQHHHRRTGRLIVALMHV